MNKSELVDAIAKSADISKAAASSALAATTETIAAALCRGDDVSLPGFGKFAVVHRSARIVRNPRTGEQSRAEAYDAPVFKASSVLKSAVRG